MACDPLPEGIRSLFELRRVPERILRTGYQREELSLRVRNFAVHRPRLWRDYETVGGQKGRGKNELGIGMDCRGETLPAGGTQKGEGGTKIRTALLDS